MLKQIEGSRAVAEAVARCRPEVVCAYPITPQTHIVEALGRWCSRASSAPLRLPQRRIRVRGPERRHRRLARRAPAPTPPPPSQGLLFMAEAVYNAAGLGLPIVMTRRQSRHRRAHQHLERPLRRDGAARRGVDPALRRADNQEAADLHVQAFRLAEALSCPVMVCVDGFVLTHAFERVDVPVAGGGRRLPSALRAATGCSTPREPVSIGAHGRPRRLHRGALPGAPQAARARSSAFPSSPHEFARALRSRSGGLLRPYRTRGRRDGRGGDGLGQRHLAGRRRRDARSGHAVGALGAVHVPPLPGRRPLAAALRSADRSSCSRSNLARAWAACSPPTCAWRSGGSRPPVHTVVAGLGGRAITRAALDACRRAGPRGNAGATCTSSTSTGRSSTARLRAPEARSGPSAECPSRRRPTRCAEDGICSPRMQRSTRPGPSPSATACSTRRRARCRRRTDRSNALTSGHRACQGCGEALGARYVLDAAMRATGGQLVAVNATGCLEVFTHAVPGDVLAGAVAALAFRATPPSVATGVAAALRRQGQAGARHRPGRRRRHDRHRLRRPVRHVRAQRRRPLRLLRQRGLHEHGRSALERHAAGRPHATTPAVGPRARERLRHGKNVPLIAMAHGIPYVATASVADLHDLEDKVEQAMMHARRPLPARPRPLSARVGRSGRRDHPGRAAGHPMRAVPALRGRSTAWSRAERPSAGACPVDDYLRLQRRFAHLFAEHAPSGSALAQAPSIADEQHRRFGLLRRGGRHERSRLPSPWTSARAARTTPARGAPSGRSTSIAWRPATAPAPRARTSRAGSTTPSRATTRARGRRWSRRIRCPRSWDAPAITRARPRATAASSMRPSASTRSSASSATWPSREGWPLPAPAPPTGKSVLVVGAGPSGLAAAYHLRATRPRSRRSGTRAAAPGGMMRFGIPRYRLPRESSTPRSRASSTSASSRARRARSTTSRPAMADGGFDACFAAIGAHLANRVDIPARDAARIFDALSSCSTRGAGRRPRTRPPRRRLRRRRHGARRGAHGKRLGAEDAFIVYRRTRGGDAGPRLRGRARRSTKGVTVRWLRTVKTFRRPDQIVVERMELDGSTADRGRRASSKSSTADTLVLALGQYDGYFGRRSRDRRRRVSRRHRRRSTAT